MAEDTQATTPTAAAAPTAAPNRDARGRTGGGRQGGRPGGRRDGRPGQAPEEKQFDERVVNIDRVARVVKGGRRFRFRALVVVGDHKGKVGIGMAKGADVTAAVSKATDVAKKQMVKVNLYKGTLPHEAEAKVSGAHILVMPAAPGTGLIAGGVVRTILEVAGVSNVLSKSLGSSNKANVAYATIEALQTLKSSKDWVTTKEAAKKKPKTDKVDAVTKDAKVTKEAPADKKAAAKKPEGKKPVAKKKEEK
jgi:small subunit ribosomal protein S5